MTISEQFGITHGDSVPLSDFRGAPSATPTNYGVVLDQDGCKIHLTREQVFALAAMTIPERVR